MSGLPLNSNVGIKSQTNTFGLVKENGPFAQGQRRDFRSKAGQLHQFEARS